MAGASSFLRNNGNPDDGTVDGDTFHFLFGSTTDTVSVPLSSSYFQGVDIDMSGSGGETPAPGDPNGIGSDPPVTEPLQPPAGLTKDILVGLISSFQWLTSAQKDAWIAFAEDHNVGELFQAMSTDLGPRFGAFNGLGGGWPPGDQPGDPSEIWPDFVHDAGIGGNGDLFGPFVPGNSTPGNNDTPAGDPGTAPPGPGNAWPNPDHLI